MHPLGIRIGTLVPLGSAVAHIPQLLPHGFESFSLTAWQTTGDLDLNETALRVRDALEGSGAIISSLSVYGNPLVDDAGNADTVRSWERLIDHAHAFGADLVSGFTGRLPGLPIPDSIPAFKKTFGELSRRAADQGVRLCFENCAMDGTWRTGDWNIAHHPQSWTLMFDALPDEHLGLEWEPCHQLIALVDPLPQLRKWAHKVFHVHGKDATVAWDVIREHGIGGAQPWAWHRTPGFGDTNWSDLITILRQAGYSGAVDIEGWHDPVYKDALEMTGQVHALHHLKRARGGDFVPNPRSEA